MKKIILVFNTLVTFLFSFSGNILNQESYKINLLSANRSDCSVNESIVTITTSNNLINASGIIVYEDNKGIYIATSYLHYNGKYNYEIVFSDYSRKKATVVGYAKEDEVLVLKVESIDKSYCSVNFSKSEYLDLNEEVDIIGKSNYKDAMAIATINNIGICQNCNEETYKNYYHSILTTNLQDSLIGAGAFDKKGQLLGLVTKRLENYKLGISMLDVNKLYAICYNLINYGKYNKNYIKYNLLNVNSLTNYEKYLYSLDEGLTTGVLVSSIHYLNYIIGGLNQGMVILSVNDVKINNCYEFDNELSKYEDGSVIKIKAKTITGAYKEYSIRL